VGAEGKAAGATVSLFDIDDLKRAVDAAVWTRDFAASIVEAVQVPLVVLDAGLRTLFANEAFRQAFPAEPQAGAGVPFLAMGGGAWDAPELRTALEGMLASKARLRGLELERNLPGAGRRTLSFSARPIESLGGEPMILVSVEDVTERSATEAERARLLGEAERAKGEAEEANRAKDAFLATLSHELRTPLTSLLLRVQRLRLGETDPQRQRALAKIEQSAKTQARLVEDLVDVSRIGAGKMKLEARRLDLASAVQEAIEALGAFDEGSPGRLDLALGTAPVWIEGDAARLQQVVWNLVGNALKFTAAPGRIRVAVDVAGGEASLSVKDGGIGIDPEFLPQVFGAFTQADGSVAREHRGLGLGLAIVRHVVALHGGTVRAESAGPGQGATFTVRLPLAPVAQPA
jgi:two-component system CheB/CheR fusion protein